MFCWILVSLVGTLRLGRGDGEAMLYLLVALCFVLFFVISNERLSFGSLDVGGF